MLSGPNLNACLNVKPKTAGGLEVPHKAQATPCSCTQSDASRWRDAATGAEAAHGSLSDELSGMQAAASQLADKTEELEVGASVCACVRACVRACVCVFLLVCVFAFPRASEDREAESEHFLGAAHPPLIARALCVIARCVCATQAEVARQRASLASTQRALSEQAAEAAAFRAQAVDATRAATAASHALEAHADACATLQVRWNLVVVRLQMRQGFALRA
jgi:hypothetical protein